METIVQLRRSEYQTLVEKSELNQMEIDRRVDEMYHKNGFVGVRLSVNINKNYDSYNNDIEVKTKAYISDFDNEHPIEIKGKRKLLNFIEGKACELFEGHFGQEIFSLEKIHKKEIKLDNIIKKHKVFTWTGWGVALLMLIAISVNK